jgi:hypothetical protein
MGWFWTIGFRDGIPKSMVWHRRVAPKHPPDQCGVPSGNRLADFVVAISELRHSAMLHATRAGYSGKSVTHPELEQDRI